MYAYDILKKRLYKLDEENYYKSSDVSSVLTGDSIVCAGYSNVFNAILKCLNIKAAPLISKEANIKEVLSMFKMKSIISMVYMSLTQPGIDVRIKKIKNI